jgi:membrane protein required for colicin V production
MFSTFDIIVFTLISISSLLGLYRGFVYTIITILGFIGSILLTVLLYPPLKNIISQYLHNEFALVAGSGAASYAISLIIFSLATSKIISIFVNNNKRVIDRLLGLVLGFLRGGLLVGVLFIIIVYVVVDGIETDKESLRFSSTKKYPKWLAESSSVTYMQKIAANIVSAIPEDVIKYFENSKNDEDENEDNNMIDDTTNKKIDDLKLGVEKLFDNSQKNSRKNDLL